MLLPKELLRARRDQFRDNERDAIGRLFCCDEIGVAPDLPQKLSYIPRVDGAFGFDEEDDRLAADRKIDASVIALVAMARLFSYFRVCLGQSPNGFEHAFKEIGQWV